MTTDAETYFKKQKSPQKEICGQLRSIILETFPGIAEIMKWGVPAYADGLFYIVALKDHVNLGFSSKSLSQEETKLFDGGGKTTRHLQFESKVVDRKRVVTLLKLVMAKRK